MTSSNFDRFRNDRFRTSMAAILRREGVTMACRSEDHDDILAFLTDIAKDLPHALTVFFSLTGKTCWVDILSEVPPTDPRIAHNRKVAMTRFQDWKSKHPDLCHILTGKG